MTGRLGWLRGGWIPFVAGLLWLTLGSQGGWLAWLISLVPGSVLLAAGVATGLWPGDARPLHFGALAGIVGTPLGLVAIAWAGFGWGIVLALASAASAGACGWLAVQGEPTCEEVPAPRRTPRLAAEAALDEALLGSFELLVPLRVRGRSDRLREEVHAALELFRDRGWLEKPADYHVAPPPLEHPDLVPERARGIAFEHMRFESGYEPHPDEPGRARWLSYAPCRDAHAWVLRHAEEGRPWLVCIHGYQMGWPLADFAAFRPSWLHHRLGLNVAVAVLPLHGPRRVGRVSGDGYLSGELLDTVHAEAQAIWDLRRLLGWIRAQGGDRVGVYGLSLGGYNAALLASLADGLACAIPGIPATDFTRLALRHGSAAELREAEAEGFGRDTLERLFRVVSPLALPPRVPLERRFIFGASADLLVPVDQVRDLWLHWERPRILWYEGAHVAFGLHREVREFVTRALRDSGLAAS